MKKLPVELVLTAIIAITIVAGCGGGGGDGEIPDPGFLRIFVDPQQVPGINSIDVDIMRVDVVISDDIEGNVNEEVIVVNDSSVTIKLIGFQGVTPNLVGAFLIPRDGFIQQIRFIVESAKAEMNGEEMPVKIPSGPQTGLKIISADVNLEISNLATTTVTLAFDIDKSLLEVNQDKLILKPVLKALEGQVSTLLINDFDEGEIIVFTPSEVTREEIELLSAEIDAEIIAFDLEIGKFFISLPSIITVRDAETFFEGSDLVDFAMPNFKGEPNQISPFDPDFHRQWPLDNTGQTGGTIDADIDAPEAWEIQTGSRDIIIAILDSGIAQHPDLVDNLFVNSGEIPGNLIDDDGNGFVDDVSGWNTAEDFFDIVTGEFSGGTDLTDFVGHGTKVAGLAGAVGDNGQGIAGVSWRVTILPVKVFPGGSRITTVDTVLDGMRYATKLGAHITNSSLTIRITESLDIADAISAFKRINSNQILHVASAGNNFSDMDALVCMEFAAGDVCIRWANIFYFPAELSREVGIDNVISVAATDQNDELAAFSNFGAGVDIAAPGTSQPTTFPGGFINLFNGTSASAPLVAGTAALIFAEFPELIGDAVSVRSKILNGANLIDINIRKGRRLNARGALDAAP